ncbi:uncharacterized protein WCC33_015398 [Rhinophrynus dorsalis]
MPKSCVASECRRIEGKRESYYKFPLHDKVRLKQWLANMNKDNFIPTKHQYLCSKHFKPSCFQYRWGVRYLKPDAVPTIFSSSGGVMTNKQAKPRIQHSVQNLTNDVIISPLHSLGTIQMQPLSGVLEAETMAIALNPNLPAGQVYIDGGEALVKSVDLPSSVMGAVNVLPLVHIVESFDGLSLALAPSQTQNVSPIALPIEVSEEQQIQHGLPLAEPITLISEEHIASSSLQHDLDVSGVIPVCGEVVPTVLDMSEISNQGALVIENISIEPFPECGFASVTPAEMSSAELLSYIETMQTATAVPALQDGPLPPLMPSPETVLSPAITGPITSTVPIVSKHNKVVSQSEDFTEQESTALVEEQEELSTAELVSIVVDLQKKVRALQQRHRRHCSKLEVMEGVVEQLKKENLISEEKLGFLEVACVQSSSALPETSNTVAIVCQEDNQTLMYTLPIQPEEENQTIFHIEEQ